MRYLEVHHRRKRKLNTKSSNENKFESSFWELYVILEVVVLFNIPKIIYSYCVLDNTYLPAEFRIASQ